MEYLFNNKSQVKFFEGTNLTLLEREVCEFMLTVRKIYNVKHFVVRHEGKGYERQDMHYVMVSYE